MIAIKKSTNTISLNTAKLKENRFYSYKIGSITESIIRGCSIDQAIKEYKAKLDECIIATSKCKDGIFIVKNRDRAYYPRIEIIHDLVNSIIERVYFFDIETGWAEGMVYNHDTGETLAIVNTALSVEYDEQEKKIIKSAKEKSIDGSKILEALTLPTFEEMDSYIEESNISGHTFLVSSTGKGMKYENSKVESAKDDLDLNLLAVRTNHGYMTKSGYQVGSDYASSKIRKASVEKAIKDDLDSLSIIEIMDKLKKKNYEYTSEFNMNRDTAEMFTTAQIGIDLSNNIFYYDNLNNKSEIIHILNKLPDRFNAYLEIKVIDAPDNLEVYDY